MVRRYTWMLCVAILCLLWLSNSLTHTTAAATPVATPALTLLQDDDAESSDADEDKSDESGEDKAEEEKEEAEVEAAFKPTAGSLSYLKIGLIVLFFIPWVRYVDSINRDTLEFGNKLQLEPEIWNCLLYTSDAADE